MSDMTTDLVSSLGLTAHGASSTTEGGSSLGQKDFLKLMIAQIATQDPTNPVKNEDFVAQLAQFSAVTGIEELSSSFETLARSVIQSQTLQAASLVGRDVLAPAQTAELDEGQGISGAVSLSQKAGAVAVEIYDASGALVRKLDLGQLESGLQDFEWDGLTDAGKPAPAGNYEFRITAQIDGKSEALSPLLSGEVESVAADVENGQLMLSVRGLGQVAFSGIYRIG